MPPLHAGDFFFLRNENRDEKIGIRKFGNRWVAKGEIHTVPAALPLLLLPDNEAAFFIRINGQVEPSSGEFSMMNRASRDSICP